MKPKIIIADEPASVVDVSAQAQGLDLMQELQAGDGISYLDLAVVEQMSHRIAVLHAGRIVDTGPVAAVIGDARRAGAMLQKQNRTNRRLDVALRQEFL